MGGSTPEWGETDDYASLEDVFTSRSFGRPLPEADAALPAAIAATSSKVVFTSNRAVAALAAAAAVVLVITGLTGLTGGPGHVGRPLISAQPSVPSSVPSGQSHPKSASSGGPAGGGSAAGGSGSTGGGGAPASPRWSVPLRPRRRRCRHRPR